MYDITINFKTFVHQNLHNLILKLIRTGINLKSNFRIELNILIGDVTIRIIDHTTKPRANFHQAHELQFSKPPNKILLLPINPLLVHDKILPNFFEVFVLVPIHIISNRVKIYSLTHIKTLTTT